MLDAIPQAAAATGLGAGLCAVSGASAVLVLSEFSRLPPKTKAPPTATMPPSTPMIEYWYEYVCAGDTCRRCQQRESGESTLHLWCLWIAMFVQQWHSTTTLVAARWFRSPTGGRNAEVESG